MFCCSPSMLAGSSTILSCSHPASLVYANPVQTGAPSVPVASTVFRSVPSLGSIEERHGPHLLAQVGVEFLHARLADVAYEGVPASLHDPAHARRGVPRVLGSVALGKQIPLEVGCMVQERALEVRSEPPVRGDCAPLRR